MDELNKSGPISRLQAQAAAAAATPAATPSTAAPAAATAAAPAAATAAATAAAAAAAASFAAAAGGIGVPSTSSSSAPSAAPIARSPAPPPAMSADPATLTHTEPPPPEFTAVEPLGCEQSASGAEVLPNLATAPEISSVERSPSPKPRVRSRSSISSFLSRPNRASKRGKMDGRGSHEDEYAWGKSSPRARSMSVGQALSEQATREQNERDLKAMALGRHSKKRGNLGGSGGSGGGGGDGGGGTALAGFHATFTSLRARKATLGLARGHSRQASLDKLGRGKTVFLFSAHIRVHTPLTCPLRTLVSPLCAL